MNPSKEEEVSVKLEVAAKRKNRSSSWTYSVVYLGLYLTGILSFLVFIHDSFTMSTYFSDNSLLPGLVNREFSLETEAEYYLKYMKKLTENLDLAERNHSSLARLSNVVQFLTSEIDKFGLETYTQSFIYHHDGQEYNGTNIYSIIRTERSTSSEAILLCAPFKLDSSHDSLASVALALSLTKYFSTKSYWAKDVIVLFVDGEHEGASAWLDSYHDINYKQLTEYKTDRINYEDLEERSGPMQAAIIFELYGKKLTRMNVKIHGNYGQLPNLDLFNLVIELAARESITPYFHNKSSPLGYDDKKLYEHHLETALSFMITQATMKSDGLHGLFLQYAIQSLTLEGIGQKETQSEQVLTFSLLSVGRMIEGIFRSLNNLTERFNRSYYFYIIVSLRRFTSIAYYMSSFGLMVGPLLLKAHHRVSDRSVDEQNVGEKTIIILTGAWALAMISLFNISSAIILAVVTVPILILI